MSKTDKMYEKVRKLDSNWQRISSDPEIAYNVLKELRKEKK